MRNDFKILATKSLSTNREIVASLNANNEIVLAKRRVFEENGKTEYYYDKGSLVVPVNKFRDFMDTLSDVLDETVL